MTRLSIQAAEVKIKNYFVKDPRFVVGRTLQGIQRGVVGVDRGFAFIVKEKITDKDGNVTEKKFVVKIGDEEEIEGEVEMLQTLSWALHIVNQYHVDNNPLEAFKKPFLMVEFLENGTLGQFLRRAKATGEVLPNRVLWSIFLCLVRACIGMAYPPQGPPVRMEETRDEKPTAIAHQDMHLGNAVFGEIEEPPFETADGVIYEHEHVPILKLIDFGLGRELSLSSAEPDELDDVSYDEDLNLEQYRAKSGGRNIGVDTNILDMGVLMGELIWLNEIAYENNLRRKFRDPKFRPHLDPDLRLLVQRCIAVNPRNRPRLDEFMALINAGAFNKNAADYGEEGQPGGPESDDMVRYIVSTYILDADIKLPPSPIL
ncbi:hypothetical protein F4776DRAFT_669652 [Hypoxylon sp. NC0597]|nr:hypothetical protein F4776DRAFT_669652 [Hypoxylon sp. NC0597]